MKRRCQDGELYRGNAIGRALDAIEWVESRRAPFSKYDLAEGVECGPRTALRMLCALEARGRVKALSKPCVGRLTYWVATTC